MNVTVEAISKFGVLNKSTKKWVNFKDQKALKEMKVGGEYTFTMEKDDKGRDVVASFVFVSTNKPEEKKTKPTEEKTDWAAKDRSQLVGGRSHDAVVLVETSLRSCTPMAKVLELYKEALQGVLKIADEVK